MDNIDSIEVLGLIAACLTTYAFLPQVYKTWKTKDVSAFSLPTFSLFFVGIVFWLVYGILKESLSMILANTITLVSSFTLLVFIFKYRKR
ncbi:MAG: SemiSWEET transporter [Flavobacteriaceae bacterium]|nr:SemiSWEET transporter [Flavobacteriaceae bacterium]MDB2493829.1 SemiSWEET transporter [Flavobacteriaceae bacterium]MDG1284526.1 SemiSWEET transporter [Flavobacteriaceae bacterium]